MQINDNNVDKYYFVIDKMPIMRIKIQNATTSYFKRILFQATEQFDNIYKHINLLESLHYTYLQLHTEPCLNY